MRATNERESSVNILMYHSISDGAGPTCIAPETFRWQMAVLEECGQSVISTIDLAAWMRGEIDLPRSSIVLTFDDGYEDFISKAFPELEIRNWSATVFLPTAKVNGVADWDQHAGGRRLMSWESVSKLAKRGIEFGAHGVEHVDLTELTLNDARREIVDSKREIESQIGGSVRTFAAPFGRTNAQVRAEIGQHFELAVGTSMASVRRGHDVCNLPRIEMWYFRNIKRWREFLLGRSRAYFFLRRTLRQTRSVLSQSRGFAQGLTGFKKAK